MSKKGKKMTEKEQTEKTAGRPAGSITSKIQPVRTVRATCRAPGCGSSDLERKRVLNDMSHFQPATDTTPATHRRRWTRAMCRKCGTWQTIIEDYNE